MPKAYERNSAQKVVEVVCRNCGYTWETNPLKWRNYQFVNRKGRNVKVVRCPVCNTPIGLTKEDVLKILRSKRRR
jgi:predicted Zn-ribbon and HTH transcriptional regulator